MDEMELESLMDDLKSVAVASAIVTSVMTALSCGVDKDDLRELPDGAQEEIADAVDGFGTAFTMMENHLDSLKGILEKEGL